MSGLAATVTAGLRCDGLSRSLIVPDGDSNTDAAFPTDPADAWAAQLGVLLATSHPSTLINNSFATGGHEWTNLSSRQAAVEAAATATGRTQNVLVLMCGTNDINSGGQTGLQAAARARTYLDAVTGSTWDHICIMQLPRNGNSGALDTEVDAYNAQLLLMPGEGRCDSVFIRPAILDGSDGSQYQDALHLSEPLGYATLAVHMLQHLKEVL